MSLARRKIHLFGSLLLALGLAPALAAHEGLHERIAYVTEKISKAP